MKRLHSSIISSADPGQGILSSVASLETWENAVKSRLGPHGLMHFMEIPHGDWTSLYGIHVGKQCTRVLLGSPIIASKMIPYDLRAVFFSPDALVMEREDGQGVDVVYLEPSSLVAGYHEADLELKKVAKESDKMITELWRWVAEED